MLLYLPFNLRKILIWIPFLNSSQKFVRRQALVLILHRRIRSFVQEEVR